MKVILKFNLNDDADKADYETMLQANKLRDFMKEFSDSLCRMIKYAELTDEQLGMLEKIKETFYEIKTDYGITDESL